MLFRTRATLDVSNRCEDNRLLIKVRSSKLDTTISLRIGRHSNNRLALQDNVDHLSKEITTPMISQVFDSASSYKDKLNKSSEPKEFLMSLVLVIKTALGKVIHQPITQSVLGYVQIMAKTKLNLKV